MWAMTPPPPSRLNHRAFWTAGGVAVLWLIVGQLVGLEFLSVPAPTPAAGAAKADEVLPERLVGRWIRPDGGYVLEIRSAQADGKLDAAYLNPRSIKVSRAEWRQEEGRFLVFIELRDVNYPGSTYNLRYVPDKDRLIGAYYQAVQKQTFDVEFARQK